MVDFYSKVGEFTHICMDPMGTDYYMPQEVLVDWGVKWWQEQPELGAEALPEPEWHRFQWPLIQLPSWTPESFRFQPVYVAQGKRSQADSHWMAVLIV